MALYFKKVYKYCPSDSSTKSKDHPNISIARRIQLSTKNKIKGGSPGLVVKGGDS